MANAHRAARFVWPLVWVVLCIFLVARATGRPSSRGVILDHLEFGHRLLAGDDVYGPWQSDPDAPARPLHAPYPPSFGLLTAPFSLIDSAFGTRAARLAWAVLQVLALLAIAWQLRQLTAPRAPPAALALRALPANGVPWHWLWFGTFLLGARFLLRDTHGGGGNLINTALCLLAFGAAERDRPLRAGLLLGLSLATKPTQLWLLPVLWLLGRRRAVLFTMLAGLGAVVATLALQRFAIGPWLGPWLRWIEGSWLIGTQRDAFAVPALDFPPFEWMNQAWRCCVARWCGTVPDEFAAKVVFGVPPGLGLSANAVLWITRLSSLAMLGWLLAAARGARTDPRARLWVFAGALVASVLLSPLSWKAHHTALLPVLFLLLQQAVALRSRGLTIVLALWAIGCALPGGDLVGDAADEWLNSIYIVTLWDVVLLGMALLAARSADSGAHSAALEHGDAAVATAAGERLG